MKKQGFIKYVLLCMTMFIVTSCGIFSLHPLYHSTDLVISNELIGSWRDNDDAEVSIFIDTIGEQKYEFVLIDGSDTAIFEMGLLKLGDQHFIDLYPPDDCSYIGDDDCESLELMFKNYIPVHTFMKIDFDGEKMVLTEFDEERLIDLFQQDRIRLEHEMIGEDEDFVVITASTSNLQKFIARYSNDYEAFNDPDTYLKVN